MKLSELQRQIEYWIRHRPNYAPDDPDVFISDSGTFKKTHSIIGSPNGDRIIIVQDNKPSVEECKCHCHVEERTGIKCRCIKLCHTSC